MRIDNGKGCLLTCRIKAWILCSCCEGGYLCSSGVLSEWVGGYVVVIFVHFTLPCVWQANKVSARARIKIILSTCICIACCSFCCWCCGGGNNTLLCITTPPKRVQFWIIHWACGRISFLLLHFRYWNVIAGFDCTCDGWSGSVMSSSKESARSMVYSKLVCDWNTTFGNG